MKTINFDKFSQERLFRLQIHLSLEDNTKCQKQMNICSYNNDVVRIGRLQKKKLSPEITLLALFTI